MASLTSSLADAAGIDRLALPAEEDREAALDPLPSLVRPEGEPGVSLEAFLLALRDAATPRHGASVAPGAVPYLVAALAKGAGARVVLVVPEADDVARRVDDVRSWVGEEAVVRGLLPPEASPWAQVSPDRRAAVARLGVLAELALGQRVDVLVVPAAALVRKFVPRAVVAGCTQRVAVDAFLDREAFARDLAEAGWTRVPVVEDPGQFAFRGALVDLWPAQDPEPLRLELLGDEVLSIKRFDPQSQRTSAADGPRHVVLPPVREALVTVRGVDRVKAAVVDLCDHANWPSTKTRVLVDDLVQGRAAFGSEGFLPAFYGELDGLEAYLAASDRFVFEHSEGVVRVVRDEVERLTRDAEEGQAAGPAFPFGALAWGVDDVARAVLSHGPVLLHGLAIHGVDASDALDVLVDAAGAQSLHTLDQEDVSRALKLARATKGKQATLAPLVRRIRAWQDHGLRVIVTARTQTQAERLAVLLRHQDLASTQRGAVPLEQALATRDRHASLSVVVAPLHQGFLAPADGIAVVTEEEVFGSRVARRRERRANSKGDAERPFLDDLSALEVGDLVVHADHGVGRYRGLVHHKVGANTVDLLVVEYDGGKLFLPVYRLNQLQKFTGGEGTVSRLDKLGGSTFSKTKSKVRKAVRQMADELLKLYAEREAQPGFAFPEAGDGYQAFEATFAYEETPDQARAIDDVNRDMGRSRPMDRLVCGDVGFGKTEVAIRAAFRSVEAGKQVAVLCPTTVLAQQHLRTFEARLKDHGVNVRGLSRFQGTKESNETILGLRDGKVDVVVGTHRILSKDVHFKDLGLLVVDEEQRFGVAHKERIKALKAAVDVLTLTATPIPRTLQLAVGGLRDLSLITTPPVDRRAVRTIVTRWDDKALREAIGRELGRGGQVFFVYNRIEGLYERAEKLRELVPNARIAVAHGQMARGKGDEGGALEQTMLDFVEGRFDILCATSIVESGLDIPRANTIIIDRADLFGLAQLYQLRGRVGRSKERAYCYLVVPPNEAMTDESRARIEALEKHTELGSGFHIASLDLELRGAGDILGGEQSGNVASVGIELFSEMLREAVAELRGEEVVHEVDPELTFDVTAFLPDDYVGDVGVRLALYKRFAGAVDEAMVDELAEELEDRFGPPPEDAARFVRLMRLKTELRRLRVLGCEATAQQVKLHLREDTPLDPGKLRNLIVNGGGLWRATPDMRLVRLFKEPGGDGLARAEQMLAELAKLGV
jgi:transcription-repair coupling factor (superfamily II helicase)